MRVPEWYQHPAAEIIVSSTCVVVDETRCYFINLVSWTDCWFSTRDVEQLASASCPVSNGDGTISVGLLKRGKLHCSFRPLDLQCRSIGVSIQVQRTEHLWPTSPCKLHG
jgi:hypothetical protein